MPPIIRLVIFCFSLFANGAIATEILNLKQILKINKNNILTPQDVTKGLIKPTENQFPLYWRQLLTGMIAAELTYSYSFVKTEGDKIYVQSSTSLDPTPIEYYIEDGIEFRKVGNDYKAISFNVCLLTIGECKYESLGKLKKSTTTFKRGLWITKLDNAKIESVYDKNGMLLYRFEEMRDGLKTLTVRIAPPQ